MNEIGCKGLDGCLDLAAAMADAGVVVCDELGALGDEGVYQDGVPLERYVTVSDLIIESFIRKGVQGQWLTGSD